MKLLEWTDKDGDDGFLIPLHDNPNLLILDITCVSGDNASVYVDRKTAVRLIKRLTDFLA